MSVEKKIISDHVFIFPFSWKRIKNGKESLVGTQGEIEDDNLFELPNWERSYFELTEDAMYNEYVYFYKPVRAEIGRAHV